jgi:hypothetical protein
VEGDAVSFVETLRIQDNDIRISYAGKLSADGNERKFTREVGDFAKEEIVARREQAASSGKVIRIKAGKFEPVKAGCATSPNRRRAVEAFSTLLKRAV